MNKNAKRIAIGTMIAGAMGYFAGLLTAPKTGTQTRTTLRNATDTSVSEIEKQLKKLHTELNQLLGEATDGQKTKSDKQQNDAEAALEGEVIGKAARAKQKTREIISAIHDGNADDKDLDKAVTEATKALNAIRSYLKK